MAMLSDRNFSETAFWEKLKRYANSAGLQVTESALKLYYALLDSDTPRWAKAVIGAALVYFVVPVDLIPDFIPGGYADDLGAMISAAAAVLKSIKPEHAQKARLKAGEWFAPETYKK
jgi:uncharacterized membrane protein YkvA (DUF1232 family)